MNHPWRGLSGLPRTSWLLALATLINRAGVMVRPFLVLYLTEQLHFQPAAAASMLTLYGATTLVAAPLSGRLCDLLGARTVIRTTLSISGLVLLLYPLAHELWQVVLATVAFALFNEMPRPALMTLVAEAAPPLRRKQAFVLSRLAINLGLSMGPAVGGLLAELSFHHLFVVDAASNLAAAALLMSVNLPLEAHHTQPKIVGERASILRDRRLWLFFAATVLGAIVFFQHDTTLSLYMVRELGMYKVAYSLTITVNTVLIVLTEIWINTRTLEWPHRRPLVIGTIFTAFGFGTIALVRHASLQGRPLIDNLLSPQWLTIAIGVVIWTVGEMLQMPAMSAYVHDLAPPDRRGSYMSTLSLAFGLGLSIGPWAGQHVLEAFGPRVLWLSALALGLASAALYSRLPDLAPVVPGSQDEPEAPQETEAAIPAEEAP